MDKNLAKAWAPPTPISPKPVDPRPAPFRNRSPIPKSTPLPKFSPESINMENHQANPSHHFTASDNRG